jgi:hypothetical protein
MIGTIMANSIAATPLRSVAKRRLRNQILDINRIVVS